MLAVEAAARIPPAFPRFEAVDVGEWQLLSGNFQPFHAERVEEVQFFLKGEHDFIQYTMEHVVETDPHKPKCPFLFLEIDGFPGLDSLLNGIIGILLGMALAAFALYVVIPAWKWLFPVSVSVGDEKEALDRRIENKVSNVEWLIRAQKSEGEREEAKKKVLEMLGKVDPKEGLPADFDKTKGEVMWEKCVKFGNAVKEMVETMRLATRGGCLAVFGVVEGCD